MGGKELELEIKVDWLVSGKDQMKQGKGRGYRAFLCVGRGFVKNTEEMVGGINCSPKVLVGTPLVNT